MASNSASEVYDTFFNVLFENKTNIGRFMMSSDPMFDDPHWIFLESVGTMRFRQDNVAKFQVTNICRIPEEILCYYWRHPYEADQLRPWKNAGTAEIPC